ncbi:MAG: DNA repair protein RadA [Segniliparus sp.]|uniref:DNA repair protein RadA n=1 Tax=Segniliparus sp. TaxID=2804064 RepID=UPI003F409D89
MSTARDSRKADQREGRHRCEECGSVHVKWLGRCPRCGAWATLVPVSDGADGRKAVVEPITQIQGSDALARPTGIREFDRVLGKGLVAGSVVLLAGEPGVGKSTLLLETAKQWAFAGRRCLYVSGEESPAQARGRAERIGAMHDGVLFTAETRLEAILASCVELKPELVVVDSVQMLRSTGEASGAISQIQEAVRRFSALAKALDISVVLIGHVTKDGEIAGPRFLEHLVDVVLTFSGEQHSRLRLLRGVKNRFGPSDEVGCFEQTEHGISAVADPGSFLLGRREHPVVGSAGTVVMHGRRPLLGEVQALVAPAARGPRTVVSGLRSDRVAKIVGVLSARCGLDLRDKDVYLSTVGGMSMHEPSADLAIALAIAGAASGEALPLGLVAFGEVALTGEVVAVSATEQRLAEAARLGRTSAIIPAGEDLKPGAGKSVAGLDLVPVSTTGAALRRLSSLAALGGASRGGLDIVA